MRESSKVKELQKELHKLKEESRSEVQQLEAMNSELLSEKVKLPKLHYFMNFVVQSIPSTGLKGYLYAGPDLRGGQVYATKADAGSKTQENAGR